MKTCHLNDYSAVGPCCSAKFQKTELGYSSNLKKHILSFKNNLRILFYLWVQECSSKNCHLTQLYKQREMGKRGVFLKHIIFISEHIMQSYKIKVLQIDIFNFLLERKFVSYFMIYGDERHMENKFCD